MIAADFMCFFAPSAAGDEASASAAARQASLVSEQFLCLVNVILLSGGLPHCPEPRRRVRGAADQGASAIQQHHYRSSYSTSPVEIELEIVCFDSSVSMLGRLGFTRWAMGLPPC